MKKSFQIVSFSKRRFVTVITIIAISSLTVVTCIKPRRVVEVSVGKMERGEMISSINATGKIGSVRETEIVSSVNSRVVKILVSEGQMVSKGSLLILLDDRDALTKISSDQAMIEEARARMDQSERNVNALKKVYDTGGTSLNSVQDAEQLRLAAKADKIKAHAALKSSILNLERFNIRAPFSGVIVRKNVHVGDMPTPGVSLLSLADMSGLEIEISVDESDAGSLMVGQEVKISCEALPDRTWTEKILRIEHAVHKDGAANTLKAHVSFTANKANKEKIHLGQQVDARVIIAKKKDVYKVPFDAVAHKDGKRFLTTIRGGQLHFEPVITGFEDANSMEILSTHVQSNEEIVLSEGKIMREGDFVKVVRRNY